MHLADLKEFTTLFVNQHLRKMNLAAYATVAKDPVTFRKITNACLKWAWRQQPKQGWCPTPPCILHMPYEDSKYEMKDLMDDIEEAFTAAKELASTLVEMKNSPVPVGEKVKKQTLLIASLETAKASHPPAKPGAARYGCHSSSEGLSAEIR